MRNRIEFAVLILFVITSFILVAWIDPGWDNTIEQVPYPPPVATVTSRSYPPPAIPTTTKKPKQDKPTKTADSSECPPGWIIIHNDRGDAACYLPNTPTP